MALPEELKQYTISKDVFLMVPLLASATGVTFDVGYFYGIGISYFTLFSLSEHLVFALEALPLALIFAIVVVAGVMIYDGVRIQMWVDDLNAKLIGPPQNSHTEVKGPLVLRNIGWKNIMYWILGAAVCGLWIYQREWTVVALTSSFLIIYVVSDLWFQVLLSRRVIMAYGCIVVLCTSFVAGYEWGSRSLAMKMKQDTIELSGSFMQGRILRSGDRGILVYLSESSEIKLVQWSEVKQIARSAR
jgi:hypothetical protein